MYRYTYICCLGVKWAGASNIDLDLSQQRVTVKGKMDAQKVFEAVKKKFGSRTLLLFPETPKEEEKKEEKQEDVKPPANEPVSGDP
jgi:hypothetical protein